VIFFLLVWDIGSYAGSFLVLFPCICVLQPQIFIPSSPLHFFLVPFPWWPGQFKISVFVSVSERISCIQDFSFLPLPYPSCMCSPLSMTCVP
jgi:hypothetical protein